MGVSKMKILHIIPNLGKGGAERICLNICHQFQTMGHEVKLIILEDINEYSLISDGIDILKFDVLKRFSVRKPESETFDNLKSFIENFQPHVVHTHLFLAEIVWKSTGIKKPSVFHIHDNIKVFTPFEDGFLSKTSWVKYYEKQKYIKFLKNQPTKFLCISEDTLNYVEPITKINGCSSVLLHNAIDTSLFSAPIKNEKSNFSLLSIGSFVPKKGQKFLIDVAKRLRDKTDKSVKLILLGDGPMRADLEAYARKLSVKDIIEFKGKVDKPEDFLKASNFYIHGAKEEPFGLVLVEAMAAGVPVLTTDGGGNRDLIKHKESGYIYFKRDPDLMVEDLLSLMENQELYSKIASKGQEFSNNFDIKIYCEKLIDIYSTLI